MTRTAEKYTEQEIEEHCKACEPRGIMPNNTLAHRSVQIIKQLQEELRQSFIEKRVYCDVTWEMPEGDINVSINQLQDKVQLLLELEAGRNPPSTGG